MRRMFSENQIKKMVKESPAEIKEALKGQDLEINGLTSKGIANTGAIANIGDIAATGAVSGKTLEQSEANWVGTLEKTANIPEGVTLNTYYERIEKINNILYLVFNYSLTNNTEASVTLGNSWLYVTCSVPEDLGEKIYRRDGNNINRTQSSNPFDNFISPLYSKQGQFDFLPTDLGAYVAQSAKNNIGIRFAGFTIPAGATIAVSGRVFLTLI